MAKKRVQAKIAKNIIERSNSNKHFHMEYYRYGKS